VLIVGDGTAQHLEMGAGSTAAVSASGTFRFRFNQTTNKVQLSIDGGAYVDLEVGAPLIENGYSEISSPVTTVSATFATVTTFDITTTATSRILVDATIETATTGGGSAVGEWGLQVNSVSGRPMQRNLSGSSDIGLGGLKMRSASLVAGTYTVLLEHRRVSGSGTLSTSEAQLSAISVAA
jgi:hypothetical protein